MGYHGFDVNHVYTSGTFAALYVKQHMPQVKKVWLFGSEGLMEELQSHDLKAIGGELDVMNLYDPWIPFSEGTLDTYPLDPEVGAVV